MESPSAVKCPLEVLFLIYTSILSVKADLIHHAQAELILVYDI